MSQNHEGQSLGDILESMMKRRELIHAYQHGRVRSNIAYQYVYDSMDRAWQREVEENRIIEAIKLYRLLYDEGLKSAKDAVLHYSCNYHHQRAKRMVNEAITILRNHVTPTNGSDSEAMDLVKEMLK